MDSSPPLAPRPRVMGILNVTPDSFSDGGAHFAPEAALAQARRLIAEGAEILDVGGETSVPISIDTMKPAVARAAVAAGAAIWNDVTALTWSPDSLAAAAGLGCEVVLMHMQGEPRSMQAEPAYDDVVEEVCGFLAARAEAAMAAGVARDRIWLDPGIGFGKHRISHNLPLLAGLDRVVALGFPVLLGASRKSFIGALDPGSAPPHDRLGGSIAAALAGAAAGVAAVRVHDVGDTLQALAVWQAIEGARR
jgi:dihydropteroate synthase